VSASVLAACLRHPPLLPSGSLTLDLCDSAERHGVAALLYRTLRDAQLLDDQPAAVRERLTRDARNAMMLEAIRHDEVRRVLDTLAADGVAPLLFKGAALAHVCYAEPWLRSRTDTDLLIRGEDRDRTSAALAQAGYTRVPRPAGAHVTHQSIHVSRPNGIDVVLDVHWKVADPQAFAELFSYGELAAEAVAIPALGRAARTVSLVHAMLIACTHRVAHHFDDDTLVFVNDIDLLARRFGPPEWSRLIVIAGEKRIRAVVGRGLEVATQHFGTSVPAEVRSELVASTASEPTAAYVGRRLRKVDILFSDLRELRNTRSRFRLLAEHLFPPQAFMVEMFGPTPRVLLPFRYLERIIRGAAGWFRPLR
jgi:putative nucleotidyltransferase-like protein